ncbi:MAG TPA: hypothetical protein DIW44_12610 [Anaerolineaceae bacterium]|nr:hypothetical protein [Anaerolineaceae bacterium]
MTSLPPNENDFEGDPCSVCTLIDCTGCLNQPDDDRTYVNGEVAALNRHVNASRKKLPPEFQPRGDNDDDDESLLPPAPRPFQPHPPRCIDVKPKVKKASPSSASPQTEKRKPGAPKGNLNALKHGIYISGQSVRNITPMERAKLGDLHDLIDHVKTYIDKVYENGLTLKSTEEMNDTLKRITSASVALTRLLHTQDALMFSSVPYEFSGETRAKTIKLLSYYQKQQDLYREITNPVPEPDQISTGEPLPKQNQETAGDPLPEQNQE